MKGRICMSLLDNVAPAPRRVMTLFYVVDTSGSMSGDKIGSVNSAMEEAITSDLPEISAANDDAEIKQCIEMLMRTDAAIQQRVFVDYAQKRPHWDWRRHLERLVRQWIDRPWCCLQRT